MVLAAFCDVVSSTQVADVPDLNCERGCGCRTLSRRRISRCGCLIAEGLSVIAAYTLAPSQTGRMWGAVHSDRSWQLPFAYLFSAGVRSISPPVFDDDLASEVSPRSRPNYQATKV
jgi:hypothetical protein